MSAAGTSSGAAQPFRFAKALKRESAIPRWLRSGPFLLLMTVLVIGSMFMGERVKDAWYRWKLEGRWIGEEEEPGGLWLREIEHRFHADGRLLSTQRLLRDGALAPEVSRSELTWEIRHSFLILHSPLTGPMPARIRHIGREEMVFGEQAKIKVFRKIPDP